MADKYRRRRSDASCVLFESSIVFDPITNRLRPLTTCNIKQPIAESIGGGLDGVFNAPVGVRTNYTTGNRNWAAAVSESDCACRCK
jgi:hypothetical protein